MIEAEELVKKYGPHLALDHVNFRIESGQVVGFLGPNGAGKTTTIRILTAFMPATSGKATVCGYDCLTQSMKVRKSIGYLPESNAIYQEMRVEEMLHYLGRLNGVDRKTRKKRIDELTEQCGLELIRTRVIGHLSKGNRQRVGLAQALLHDPPVLILDEPGSGLDPVQIAQIRELIKQLGETKTILFSTHILPEAEQTCDRLIIISGGKIMADGPPSELVAQLRASANVLLNVQADETELFHLLKNIPGVASVQTADDHGWVQASVKPETEAGDLRPLISKGCMQQGWTFKELKYEDATLEEFFVHMTSPDFSEENSRAQLILNQSETLDPEIEAKAAAEASMHRKLNALDEMKD